MARVILAVVVGFVVWSVLWVGLSAVLPAVARDSFNEKGMTTNPGILAVLLIGSVVCSVASGWVAARIAPHKAQAAAAILGIALLAVGIAVQASVWNSMPLWYHLPFLALLLPATWFGATLLPRTAPASSPSLATAR